MKKWLYLAPVVALATTGCLASKADIVLLQDEIRALRASQVRADSARKAQDDATRAATLASLTRTQDSIRNLSLRLGAFQATAVGELYEMSKQLLQIAELAGMSTKRIMELRSSMEERGQAMTGSSSDTSSVPKPAQLFMQASDLLRRGSHSSARAGFEELLRLYPDFDEASQAQMLIGTSYADEKRTAEADSVYLLVAQKYPRSVDAPTSLFKLAGSMAAQKKTAAARTFYNRVIREYPKSVEADLAAERLKTLR
ncbi:MAG: tetratricopeptide repeat protein [Gemmatimonadaceae bacterium]